MEVVIATPTELAALAADAIEALLTTKPDAVLGLATGSSPLGIYDELVRRHQAGRIGVSTAWVRRWGRWSTSSSPRRRSVRSRGLGGRRRHLRPSRRRRPGSRR